MNWNHRISLYPRHDVLLELDTGGTGVSLMITGYGSAVGARRHEMQPRSHNP